ncbi:malto-oligosyltrehalose trehalohydrolase [Chitinispirillales bacterium ANBcel5]|uniref:malto-oligosyltrehalose trehalohydrolase n=1 Tax=Cellulosispirillum alkaliphilum TaxID=3039283 RepID=UPI002A53F6B5|nr:malto-oligosyltrehalose trehalohydrolase [Chitinispirillales bacterium ANBcel5]
MHIGAHYEGDGQSTFKVWAPQKSSVELHILEPQEAFHKMEKDDLGYWHISHVSAPADALYMFRLDGKLERPDPASRYQPRSVHGPSSVIDHSSFKWSDDNWKGITLQEMVIYELHIGTFTSEGTFDACIEKLDYLKSMGITAIEVMPVAQFPGDRNWGYDGVYPFAVQDSYGGPEGLKRLVNACHKKEMAVVLDVVYNHLGPEGAYVMDFAPYFTDQYSTPWGAAVNYDQAWSYGVRDFFVQNALSWFKDYNFDALRLDAIHGIYDFGAKHILREISEKVEQYSQLSGRKRYLIAESDLNDTRVLSPVSENGMGIDAQWNDSFHHALHTLITAESKGYYSDYGSVSHLIKALKEGFVYSWDYSNFRKRFHGSSSKNIAPERLVICTQNHDQIGNRMLGERLSMLASFEELKVGAATMLLSPNVPLLFMGEEFAAKTPFLYFISHTDEELVEAVRQGRAREFSEFLWEGDPPDPQAESTFRMSKLDWDSALRDDHKVMSEYYRALLELRRKIPALSSLNKKTMEISAIGDSDSLVMRRWNGHSRAVLYLNFSNEPLEVNVSQMDVEMEKVLDSADKKWSGGGSDMPEKLNAEPNPIVSPQSAVLYLV